MKKTAPKKVPTGDEPRARSGDVVIVHGVTEDRKGLRVLRARNQTLEAGEVRPVVEGQPITSDLLRLKPRPNAPFVCDVETTYRAREASSKEEVDAPGAEPRRSRSGPAQVASASYRENWDAIWAKRVSAPGSSELN